MEERTKWDNGVHKLEFEPPDVFHCYINGSVTLDEAKLTMKILQEEVTDKFGPAFFVSHLLPGGGQGLFTPEARKYFGTLKPFWKASIMIGGSAISRAAVNVAARAINLMSSTPIPIRAVKSKEEAYAVMDELRADAKAQAAGH